MPCVRAGEGRPGVRPVRGAGLAAVDFQMRRRTALPYVGLGAVRTPAAWGLWWARSLGLSCGLPGSGRVGHGVCGLPALSASDPGPGRDLRGGSAAPGRSTRLPGGWGRARPRRGGGDKVAAAIPVAEPTLAEWRCPSGATAVLTVAAARCCTGCITGGFRRQGRLRPFLLAHALLHFLVGVVGEACPTSPAGGGVARSYDAGPVRRPRRSSSSAERRRLLTASSAGRCDNRPFSRRRRPCRCYCSRTARRRLEAWRIRGLAGGLRLAAASGTAASPAWSHGLPGGGGRSGSARRRRLAAGPRLGACLPAGAGPCPRAPSGLRGRHGNTRPGVGRRRAQLLVVAET